VWAAIALSFGLAMDATAVSAARGLAGHNRREPAILPIVFGGFQSGMSSLGWLGGEWASAYASWYRWVAFGLLAVIGLKMMVDSLFGSEDEEHVPGTVLVYLGLGIATSIDAAIAGLTLPILPIDPVISIVLIGAITAVCSIVGFLAGRAIGGRVGTHLGVLGGIVLIAIGVVMIVR
jgi:manganese efflux pump family protein